MIALNLIIKNDAIQLEKCLEYHKDYFDEIVIAIDSENTDNSLEIARNYGAKVIIADWDYSFSKMKNLCITYTDSEWIFSLGADEISSKDFLNNLQFLILSPDYDFYSMKVIHEKEKKTEWQVRLFRTSKGKFIMRLHEFLDGLIEDQSRLNVLPEQYYLRHLQLQRSPEYEREKLKRYKELENIIRKKEGLILKKKGFKSGD